MKTKCVFCEGFGWEVDQNNKKSEPVAVMCKVCGGTGYIEDFVEEKISDEKEKSIMTI